MAAQIRTGRGISRRGTFGSNGQVNRLSASQARIIRNAERRKSNGGNGG